MSNQTCIPLELSCWAVARQQDPALPHRGISFPNYFTSSCVVVPFLFLNIRSSESPYQKALIQMAAFVVPTGESGPEYYEGTVNDGEYNQPNARSI